MVIDEVTSVLVWQVVVWSVKYKKRGKRLNVILRAPGRKDEGRQAAEVADHSLNYYDVLRHLAMLMLSGMHVGVLVDGCIRYESCTAYVLITCINYS